MARRKRFGDMKHRKWHKAPGSRAGSGQIPTKRIGATVWVRRRAQGEMGEGGRAKPFVARICVGTAVRSGRQIPRKMVDRCSSFDGGRGSTPTKAIKAALRDLAKKFK